MFGRGIFNSDGRLWRFQRKVASHIFTSNSLRDFVVDIAGFEICHRLVPALNSACEEESGRPIDLQALFMDFTFDTSSQLTFGADPAALIGCIFWNHGMRGHRTLVKSKIRCKSNSDCAPAEVHPDSRRDSSHLVMEVPHYLIRGFAHGFPVALEVIANRFLLPTFLWKLQRFLNIGSERKLREALKVVNEFAAYVIEKSKVESSGRRDLLARFMQLSKAEVSRLLDDDDEAVWKVCSSDKNDQVLSESLLKDILLSFILAGRDTVASGLSFFVWQICLHPEVEKRIYEEVQVIIRDRQLKQSDSEGAGIFSYEEIRKMNYLHAAFSESMRLSPPVPSNPKYAAEDDTLPDGTKICKGYAVSYNVFALCRAQQIWGNDSLEFKPDRWLDQNGQFVTADPFKYPVFQAGPRTCLGKDFAYIQVKLVVACLVRDYVFSLSPGFKPNLSFGVNLNMTNGLPVTVRRRE
ncbi:hypothetical protein KP509_24G011100 [Ceratopteris richardii]|nr:hypothetical protein KP509_24G011100 [Ceratopteris richardii]